MAVALGLLVDRVGVREIGEGEGLRSAHLRRGDRERGTCGVLPPRVVVPADEAGRAQDRECELAAGQLILRHLVEQEGHAARGDEGRSGIRRDRHLPVPAFGLEAALDDSELSLRA